MHDKILENRYVISMPESNVTFDPRGVGYVYFNAMKKYYYRTAQIDGRTGEQQNFGTLLKYSIRTSITMQNKGIKPGDFISICSFTHLNSCLPYIASLFTGAIMAAVDPSMSAPEIIYLLNQVHPKMIFVSTESLNLIEEVVEKLETKALIVVFGETPKHLSFSEFLKVYENEKEFSPREATDVDETVLVIFSSGTTGKPKGICHTHTSIQANDTLSNQKEHMVMASFFSHYWGVFSYFMHISISNGLGRLVFPKFNNDNPWELLNFKIHFAFLSLTNALQYLKHKKPDHINLENLEYLVLSGNYISNDNILKIKAQFPKTIVHNAIGQSEVTRTFFEFPANLRDLKLSEKYTNSVGCPINGFSYKIVNFKTEEILGPNQEGELRIKSKAQTKGYYNRDSSETFDSEGWLKTGDLAYYNKDKCFFITGRIKESFKYLDTHIIPTDIETVLLKHPAVETAVVIGFPHHIANNHPMGVIVLKNGIQNVTEKEIIEFLEDKVTDENRLRGGVKFVKSIPVTPTCKINRYKLTQMVINHDL